MTNTYDIIIIGDYFFDLIFSGLQEFPQLGREVWSHDLVTVGGAMYITATALHRLDVRTGWPGTFGNDPYSQAIYALAQQEGIDLSLARVLDRPYRHVTTSMPLQDERAFVTYVDPAPEDTPDYLVKSLENSDFKHLHFGGLASLEEAGRLIDVARARGATISMDCQDASELYTGCEWKRILAAVDVFMPNAREAKMITRLDSTEEAARKLAQWTGVVVVKDGCNGAWAAGGDELFHDPCVEAGPLVDTTGAGDCFNAGFLRGYVVEHAPLNVCLRYGNICGGFSVTAVGGATAAPTYTELQAWMEKSSRPHSAFGQGRA